MAANYNMLSAFCDYLDRNDWHYDLDTELKIIRGGLNIRCKLMNIRFAVHFNDSGFTTLFTCPLNADEETRPEVMKYLTMANYGLRNGNFEMDLRDGEIRYKIYTDASDMTQISDRVLTNCMLVPPAMFEHYGNGLAAILMGVSDADTAIKSVES